MSGDARWWGWGRTDVARPLPDEAKAGLFSALQIAHRRPSGPPSLPKLPPAERVEPPCRLDAGDMERLLHCGGKSTPDLIRARTGRIDAAPDAVAYPERVEEVRAVLDWAARENCAVVPFGGGTSVVGGVAPIKGDHRAVVTLDMRNLARLIELDRHSGLARVECGIFGPELERALNEFGWSLGHFPQSFEFSTLGGWIATRSAGQNSTRYGKIEDLVAALRAVTPAGEIVTRSLPANATGPELREVMVGSEGALGVLVEATMRVHRKPEETRFASFLLESFLAGAEAVRTVIQDGLRPAILRLSNERETAFLMSLSGADRTWGAKVLKLLGKGSLLKGVHLMLGFEGSEALVDAEMDEASRLVRRCGGTSIGSGPGKRWRKDRFGLPYLRDALLDLGILVDTLETATTWTRLTELYRSVCAAIATPIVLCHISHAYPDGASLYFTFLADAPDPDRALAEWARVKQAAGDAIIAAGGTISHHHAVGADHRPWLAAERGPGQVEILRVLKRALDPAGVLNPGKLIP